MSAHALHYFLSLFLTTATTVGLGVFVLFQKHKQPLHRIFAWYSFAIGYWSLLQALMTMAGNSATSLLLGRMMFVGVMLIPALFFHFVTCLLDEDRLRRWLVPNYLACVAFIALIASPAFISKTIFCPILNGYFVAPGRVFFWHLLWYLSVANYCLFLLWKSAASASGPRRNQLLYLALGSTLGYLGGWPNYLYMFDRLIPVLNPFGTYAVPLYVMMTAYAIVRHQLMDIRIILRTSLVYSFLVGCITVTYLVAVMIMERWFQGFIGYRSLLATGLVGCLIAAFFNPLRQWIQALVDRALFSATPPELAAQREQLLVEVSKSDQMKAVATLAAGLAHEIRNPLSVIKTFTEHIDADREDPEFQRKFKRIVGGEVERINLIAQRLLDFAKPSPPQLISVSVPQLLDDTLELLGNELAQRHVEVTRQYQDAPPILGDPKQLKQVFLNLLLNSLQAVNGHGQFAIKTAVVGQHLEVRISDNGCGIPKEHLERIFEPFFTTRSSGTGLGLAVVKGIVEDHGGKISIESRLNEGTTASVRFPMALSGLGMNSVTNNTDQIGLNP